MTITPPSRTQKPDNESLIPKPYNFVTFPKERPIQKAPVGHHKYEKNLLHGTLYLTLTVKTSLHVSTGIVAMGSDIGSKVSLIKTMVQGTQKQLLIQGSSLKGCIRSVYEAITNSTLAVVTGKYKDKIPPERLPCKSKEKLCPASRVFGAMDWQGLIEFNDAKCESSAFNTGFMPSLYSPRPQRKAYYQRGKVAGRKFYYHTVKAIEKGQNQGIPVQQAAQEYTFTTKIQFKNLKSEELGTLFIVLGQDPKHPIALKVGGGKPIGMGTMTVNISKAVVLENPEQMRSRYSSYIPPTIDLSKDKLKQFILKHIQTAHSNLIQTPQLQQLAEVLHYPTDRQPPQGMY
ncbi:MAG: RAMP superfamily CRISPR-associated protein [Mastigocoleus sp.]